jgi:hypothetical protein
MTPHDLHVSTRVLPDGHKFPFRVAPSASLLEVLQTGAERAGVPLLPSAEAPLDQLRNIGKHHEPGPPISDLDQAVGPFLSQPEATSDFGITLVRAIRVNTQWRIAPESSMSPRQILGLFGLDPQEYSLYRTSSPELLPVDTAIALSRGDAFEAQRDGKYGQGGSA